LFLDNKKSPLGRDEADELFEDALQEERPEARPVPTAKTVTNAEAEHLRGRELLLHASVSFVGFGRWRLIPSKARNQVPDLRRNR
jgi:hypothetical protein